MLVQAIRAEGAPQPFVLFASSPGGCFYQESLRAPLRPANAQRAAHVESPNLLPASLASSHLQTKQLQPGQAPTYLESPEDEATPARLGTQAIMPMYAYNSRNRGSQPPPPQSQSSREAVPWGSSTLISCPNTSRNRSWEMSPTLRSNSTSQGANKPFLTQPSAAQSTEL
jgi:hypothetical protein